jgi:hypothetical protein
VLEHNFDNINKILSLKNDKTSSYNDFLKDYKTKFNDEKFNELRRLIDAAEESAKNSINNILSTKINELIKTEFKESNIKYNDKEIYLSNPTLRVIEDLTIFLNDFKQNFKGKYINNNINDKNKILLDYFNEKVDSIIKSNKYFILLKNFIEASLQASQQISQPYGARSKQFELSKKRSSLLDIP